MRLLKVAALLVLAAVFGMLSAIFLAVLLPDAPVSDGMDPRALGGTIGYLALMLMPAAIAGLCLHGAVHEIRRQR